MWAEVVAAGSLFPQALAAPSIDSGQAGSWVLVVLTGGGAAAIYTLVKAALAVSDNVETREATAIGNLEKWRIDADARADAAESRCAALLADLVLERRWGTYWERRSANAERALAIAGLEVPDPPTEPPSRP